MSFIKAHDLKAFNENDPSVFLFEKLNAFVELFSFIELTTEQHSELPHYGFRIVPNTKVSLEQNIQATFNSFPEFFLNRVIPYFHYYVDRGTDWQSVDHAILVVVYYDFIAKYKIDLHDMDMKAPVNLLEFKAESVATIKKMSSVLALEDELSVVCFNDSVYNRENILKEII